MVDGPACAGAGRRLAHLTTVDMSLALLLGTELAADVEAGYEVFGLSAPGPFVEDVAARGVRHVAVPSLTRTWDLRRDARAVAELHRALRDLRPDILHTHTPKAGLFGRVVGRSVGIPVVVNTVHGLWAAPDAPLARRALVWSAEAIAARFSDEELYQNDADRHRLRRAVSPTRSRTVGNGVDLERFRPDDDLRRRVRAELGVGPDEVLVGGVGRRVTEKGINEYAAAAQALAGRARFVWVGPEDEDKADRIAQVDAPITLLGLRLDVEAVYNALDVFVLPSYREGFSRSAMEAAATGCAIVLTDIRGCREIGRHGVELLLVPPRDAAAVERALSLLIEDGALRRRLSAAARARALVEFDQRRVARESMAAYRRVAERKRLGW